ncbi:major facilitator superfamily domain-containing protein [Podospora australis]|uniref:Major facilitator superfamily domain-containing protein n=1 Tax=Podospora australis TaxID=1536484 RepID=A0AAN7AML0_9PEZI|nr:major facilitator superfamily domain-containing protein [Podospora australis]
MEASRTAVFSIGTVFSLSATIFQQPIAEISHVLGRKPAFLIVLVVFALGSIVAGTAKDMKMLLIGRAMQGFASGGSVLAAIVLTDLIELRDRATWISVQNGIQALGLVLGPLIGAGLLHASSWRWLFYVNLPAIAVSAAGLSLLLGFDKPQQGVMVCLSRVDWVGLGIFIPSSMAFLSPFTMAGVLYKWSSWKALVPLIFGILGLITLAVHQRHFASYPMFRASVFEKRVTVSALVGLTIFGTCVNMIFYYLVVFWSGVRGLNEILTGIALLPETFTMPIAAIICGLVMRKRNNIREAMLVSWPLTTISLGLLWFLDAKTPLAALIVINMGVGLGAGAASSALHITVLAATKREDNGHATAMSYLFRSAGMCLGIAVGTAIFTMGMNERFGQMEDSEMTAESILRMLKDVKKDPESRDAIVRTLRLLWMTCCALSGIAGLICCSCQYPGLYRTPKPHWFVGQMGDGVLKSV